ncbi:hypothetical protein D3C87_1779990 [compost metagenome]
MRAAFGNLACAQHDDLVGADDGRKPVGDDKRRAIFRNLVERRLDLMFSRRVECRGRLVEYEDRRGLQNRAGDRHPLLFSAGKF